MVVIALLVAWASPAKAQSALSSQVPITYNDPSGQGTATYTIFYSMPQQAQVGSNLVVPFKLYVDNLTRLMNFLNDYNVTLSLSLHDGKQLSATEGVTGTEAANDLGALQLHTGQGWGPVNFTIPLTTSNTGLGQGQEVLVNASMTVLADIYFNQPVNTVRFGEATVSVGDMAIADGTPSGPQTNYLGIGLLGMGLVLVVVAVAVRERKAGGDAAKKAPGSV